MDKVRGVVLREERGLVSCWWCKIGGEHCIVEVRVSGLQGLGTGAG